MTDRDEFAKAALPALIAIKFANALPEETGADVVKSIVRVAYELADAMLWARCPAHTLLTRGDGTSKCTKCGWVP